MPRLTPAARRALVEERKAQILSAAAKVFARKGFERATIADIAREAGVSEGSIYNYFKNKGDLLVSIPRRLIQPAMQVVSVELTRRSDGIAPDESSPEQVLTIVARQMVATVRQNADILRVMLSSLPAMNRAMRAKYLEQAPLYAFHLLETYFRQQVEAGVFRKDVEPAIAARMFPGMLFPFLVLQELLGASEAERFDYDRVIAHAVRTFLNGMLASPKGKR